MGLAGLSVVGGLIGLFYISKKRSKENMENTKTVSGTEGAKLNSAISALSKREKEELQDRIKAMSTQEQEVLLEVIPVSLCMKRIQQELDHAREFESMIKRAYEMK